jgi:short-subunit dehydrogenase
LATCVIMGAGPGVSNSVAKSFLARGYHVALCARNNDKLKELACALGTDVSTWPLDVADSTAIEKVVGDIAKAHGEIEVLLYNAYVQEPGKGSTLDLSKFNQSLTVNVSGALAATQAVLPEMISKEKGSILFTGGGLGTQPFYNMTALSVGKAALRALALCLNQELGRRGIHVGTVTICGIVKPGSKFDPDVIAASFMQLHDQPAGSFDAEIVFDGK